MNHPRQGGEQRVVGTLVAAEKAADETRPVRAAAAPLEHDRQWRASPALYELHVWAWRDNPNGTFVDWNPQVSCDGIE
jgi:hypothetical protein